MKKLLLHACCGPCATYSHRVFEEAGWNVTAYFFNPNIYPEYEFVKRYVELKRYCGKSGLPLVFDFENVELTPGQCSACYGSRLKKTAAFAKENGFEAFSTTLLISPYQDHELIKKTGENVSDEMSVDFVYDDLRTGYRESRIISREHGLYMQKYCGCENSFRQMNERSKKNERLATTA